MRTSGSLSSARYTAEPIAPKPIIAMSIACRAWRGSRIFRLLRLFLLDGRPGERGRERADRQHVHFDQHRAIDREPFAHDVIGLIERRDAAMRKAETRAELREIRLMQIDEHAASAVVR